jgi:geranylgeranyl pyrophosphate synthase
MINQRFYPLFRQVFLEIEETLWLWDCDTGHQRQLHRALDKLRQDFWADRVFPALMGPWLSWGALGREPDAALRGLGVAHVLFYAFLDLTDDVEDHELNPAQWSSDSEAVAINTGTGLLFLALLALERLAEVGITAPQISELRLMFCQAGWRLTAGQYRDLTSVAVPLGETAFALETIRLKTGTSVRLYFQSAARLAGADPVLEEMLGLFGEQLGLLAQLRGDYLNLFVQPTSSDLSNGCRTLPLHLAFTHLSPDDRELLETALKQAVTDQAAHTVIRHLLRKSDCRTSLNLRLEACRTEAERLLGQLDAQGCQIAELSLFLSRLQNLD